MRDWSSARLLGDEEMGDDGPLPEACDVCEALLRWAEVAILMERAPPVGNDGSVSEISGQSPVCQLFVLAVEISKDPCTGTHHIDTGPRGFPLAVP